MHNALPAQPTCNPLERLYPGLARRVLQELSNTGAVMQHRTSSKSKLIVRKETLRQLRQLSDDELRAAGGGQLSNLPPPPRPSLSGC